MRSLLIALFGLALSGCCGHAWDKFPMPKSPDRACHTGSAAGYDVYIWECTDNQKVVIYQYTAEMSCQAPAKETAACGATTPIEQRLGDAVGPQCTAVPAQQRWP